MICSTGFKQNSYDFFGAILETTTDYADDTDGAKRFGVRALLRRFALRGLRPLNYQLSIQDLTEINHPQIPQIHTDFKRDHGLRG